MTKVGPQVGAVRASADARPPEEEGASRLATGIAVGTAAAATSFMPAAYAKGLGRQAAVTAIAGLVGFGAGNLIAAPAADLVGSGDAVQGGLLVGAAGLVTAVIGRHVPGIGSMRDAGRVVTSLGTIAAVGGGAVAATEAVDRADLPILDSKAGAGLIVGAAGSAAVLGVLALKGGFRGAPNVAEAALRTVTPSADDLAAWTPELASADNAARSGAAKQLFEQLPGTDANSWKRIGTGRTFLRGVATPEDIRATSGLDPIATPRRLVVAAKEAKTPEARAALMLERFDAAGGIKYGTIHVVSPAAIGDTDEVVPLTVEHARRGNVITLMTQTSQTEPYFVLHKVPQAQRTLDLVVKGLNERIQALPPEERPEFLLSALCYGALSPVELGIDALKANGVQHVLLEGSPALRRESRALAGRLARGEQAGVIAYSGAQLDELAASGAPAPDVTMLMHRNDPLRVGLQGLLVPPSTQEGRPFIPVMSAINAFGDFGIDMPKEPGLWYEVGHRYQATGVSSANAAFGLGLEPEQAAAIRQHAVLRDALRGMKAD
ncbi:MAG: putative rane protein [Thermoleophilia bacterium]|nr:putative rane protein [Thermoleophilia bacterium]